MAKRFIDTELFNDKWFMSLKKDAKLFWIYLITSCNHAGIIEMNEPLMKLQTGINSLQTVIKELENRLIPLENDYYFIPKFLEYQYNKFPNSKVRAQKSAIDLLIRFNLWDAEKQTVIKGLVNSYVYDYEHGSVKKKTAKDFYDEQLKTTNNHQYVQFVEYLFGKNMLKEPLKGVLSIEKQLTPDEFENVMQKCSKNNKKIGDILTKIENKPKYYKDATSLYRTLLNWSEDRFTK